MIELQDIQRRVAALNHRPGSSEIFGAEKHRFRLRPHSPKEVARLELHLGVTLPDSYRQFLTEVGSGAGPYYGIYSPDELLENFARIQSYLDEEQPRPNPSTEFAFNRHDAAETATRLRDKVQEPWLCLSWPTHGCVPICFQGCTYWSALITAGECAGTVWDVACYEGWNGQWSPARRASGLLNLKTKTKLLDLSSPPTFLEWYEAWLERVEADLAS
jgi:hypothetical protein